MSVHVGIQQYISTFPSSSELDSESVLLNNRFLISTIGKWVLQSSSKPDLHHNNEFELESHPQPLPEASPEFAMKGRSDFVLEHSAWPAVVPIPLGMVIDIDENICCTSIIPRVPIRTTSTSRLVTTTGRTTYASSS